MTVKTPSLWAGIGMLAVLGTALAACATPAGSGGTVTPEETAAPDVVEVEVDAAWLDSGRMVGIVTVGSSTCVPMAEPATYADGVLQVTLTEEPDAACTRDLVPRVTLVDVPDDVDPSQDLEIIVSGETGAGDAYAGETSLDGVDGLVRPTDTDYLPTAGWTDVDGQFVILSWGSSSCAPVLEAVEATGPAEVTVTFQTFPENQVCTMDMAPRALVAYVDGVDDSDTFAVLQGAEFDNVRIPVYPN
jgi:hypothetical protein